MRFFYENEGDIPESLKSEYQKNAEGKFVLKLEDATSYEDLTKSVTALENTATARKRERDDYHKRLKDFEQLGTIDEVKTWIDELNSLKSTADGKTPISPELAKQLREKDEQISRLQGKEKLFNELKKKELLLAEIGKLPDSLDKAKLTKFCEFEDFHSRLELGEDSTLGEYRGKAVADYLSELAKINGFEAVSQGGGAKPPTVGLNSVKSEPQKINGRAPSAVSLALANAPKETINNN